MSGNQELEEPSLLSTLTEGGADHLHVVISRRDVESGTVRESIDVLLELPEDPLLVARFRERVIVSCHGYENTSEELFEIPSVRDAVYEIDELFPYWMYFLDKSTSSLQAIILCFLPPFLTAEAKAAAFPGLLDDLLNRRWWPAMNHMCMLAGLSHEENIELTNRGVTYLTRGPITES